MICMAAAKDENDILRRSIENFAVQAGASLHRRAGRGSLKYNWVR